MLGNVVQSALFSANFLRALSQSYDNLYPCLSIKPLHQFFVTVQYSKSCLPSLWVFWKATPTPPAPMSLEWDHSYTSLPPWHWGVDVFYPFGCKVPPVHARRLAREIWHRGELLHVPLSHGFGWTYSSFFVLIRLSKNPWQLYSLQLSCH